MARRPILLATATAVVSIAMLAVAVRQGWLGPAVGRGGGFCEASRDSLIRQPANTWSNLGFVIAGLLIGMRAGAPATTIPGRVGIATAFACLVVLLGPASAAMHATETALGGHLDLLSMFLVASFASAYAVMRVARRGPALFVAWFAAALVLCEILERVPGPVPVFMIWANVAFGGLLLIAAIGEEIIRIRGEVRLKRRWGLGAVGALALAFTVWNLSKDGGPLCDPHSLLQGHAFWHLMCAVAAWCLYRLWASERPERRLS